MLCLEQFTWNFFQMSLALLQTPIKIKPDLFSFCFRTCSFWHFVAVVIAASVSFLPRSCVHYCAVFMLCFHLLVSNTQKAYGETWWESEVARCITVLLLCWRCHGIRSKTDRNSALPGETTTKSVNKTRQKTFYCILTSMLCLNTLKPESCSLA